MSKYIDNYKREHYKQIIISLKPNEKELLDKICNKKKLSRRQLLLNLLEKEK